MSKLFDPDNKTEKTLIQKAQKLERGNSGMNFRVAVLSAFGWYMSIPVLCGIAFGQFMDRHFPVQGFSWILNCIFLGFAVGIGCVAYWVRKEGLLPFKSSDKSMQNARLTEYTHQQENNQSFKSEDTK